jgi:hypothetical protein
VPNVDGFSKEASFINPTKTAAIKRKTSFNFDAAQLPGGPGLWPPSRLELSATMRKFFFSRAYFEMASIQTLIAGQEVTPGDKSDADVAP